MPTPHNATAETDEELGEAVGAIEELVAEFGVRGVISACLRSSIGEELGKGNSVATQRVVQAVLREIVFSKDPRLEAEVMALGSGLILALTPDSRDATITAYAAKHGITKQALSKRVVKFCDDNGLPPSIYMKTLKNRKTYALTNQPRTA